MTRKKYIILSVIGGVFLVALSALAWMGHVITQRAKNYTLLLEGQPTEEQLVNFLNSSDPLILGSSLTLLEHRRHAAGREGAVRLLTNPDPSVWYAAALYLGSLGDGRSVPYLIRGLDHRSWRSRPRVVGYLKDLTLHDIGENKEDWIKWWTAHHAGKTFDFAIGDAGTNALKTP